jgi:hypothetical protein
MTRVHFTAFSYPTLQLLLTPPQLFGFTPHLSSSSPLISSHLQTVSFSARSLPSNPKTPISLSVTVPASRALASHHAAHHAATLPPCKDFSRFSGVVSRLGLDNGIPISMHTSAIPGLYRTKGTCVTDSKRGARAADHM